ncbi:MAG TPA: metal ABC transporter permease [Candidatus Poseidoniales archaeon]|nr:MAG TPA: metal ABC transporter permease [Candidatus Poseidoniales archaeon]|tara:strand:+ start:1567 stop:2535 length:969 start_codon:yes stop_codon:yes gene_type:complete
MMGLGVWLLEQVAPLMEFIAPIMPGEVFPYFFTMEMFQRAMLAALVVTVVAGVLGSFLLVRNMALIGDGIAHVAFGGVAVGLVASAAVPIYYAVVFAVIAAIIIDELQHRELLNGDTAIAIIMTGALGLGLVVLRLPPDWFAFLPWHDGVANAPMGITPVVEAYLYGNLLLIDEASLDLITTISFFSIVGLLVMYKGLLASAVDPIAARVQGIPVRAISLAFSIITAVVVVSMVKIIGALLVTAILVSPAATAQQVGKSFRACMLWTQAFGFLSVFLGIYLSAELGTGSGSMIALVAALVFATVTVSKLTYKTFFLSKENVN